MLGGNWNLEGNAKTSTSNQASDEIFMSAFRSETLVLTVKEFENVLDVQIGYISLCSDLSCV